MNRLLTEKVYDLRPAPWKILTVYKKMKQELCSPDNS